MTTALAAGTAARSAYDPRTLCDTTRSPTLNPLTPAPIDRTTPAASEPSVDGSVTGYQSLAEIDVDEVDADRFDVDQQLAGAERGLVDVLETENLGPARLVNADRFHQPRSIALAIVCSCMLLVPS